MDLETRWVITCMLHVSALSHPIIEYVNTGKI